MKKVSLGIDIGGTNTVFGFIDIDGNSIAEGSISTVKKNTIEGFISDLKDEFLKVKSTIKEEIEILGIGIGAPNANHAKGTIENAPNLQWKGVVPLVDIVSKAFELPAFMTNDANAAAIGEMIYGGAKNMKDFMVITLGTGLGSGIIVNGELLYGHHSLAGEVGHMIISPGGRNCGCGRKGCLETYVSATGVKRTVYKLLADHLEESELRDIPFNKLTAKMVADAANRGDIIAKEVFEHTGRMLGEVLANAAAVTNPEAIFLFGGLAKAGDLIFNPTIEHFRKNLLFIYNDEIKILPSEIEGNAAVLGASALVWKELN